MLLMLLVLHVYISDQFSQNKGVVHPLVSLDKLINAKLNAVTYKIELNENK